MVKRCFMLSLNVLASIHPEYKVLRSQVCSVHTPYFACLNLVKYVVPFSRYCVQFFDAKCECLSMYTAGDRVFRTQVFSVHAQKLVCLVMFCAQKCVGWSRDAASQV